MNIERLDNLAEQLKLERIFAGDTSYTTLMPLSPEMLEFVELIVRECAAVAWLAEQNDRGNGTPISKQIEHHFGLVKRPRIPGEGGT